MIEDYIKISFTAETRRRVRLIPQSTLEASATAAPFFCLRQ